MGQLALRCWQQPGYWPMSVRQPGPSPNANNRSPCKRGNHRLHELDGSEKIVSAGELSNVLGENGPADRVVKLL